MVQKRTGAPSDLTTFEQALLKSPLTRDVFEDMTQRRGVSKEKLLALLFRIPHLPTTKGPLVVGESQIGGHDVNRNRLDRTRQKAPRELSITLQK
jgi:hypothetical protein